MIVPYNEGGFNWMSCLRVLDYSFSTSFVPNPQYESAMEGEIQVSTSGFFFVFYSHIGCI